jgi:hypothetical protein
MRAYGTDGTIRGTNGTNYSTNQESGITIMVNPLQQIFMTQKASREKDAFDYVETRYC